MTSTLPNVTLCIPTLNRYDTLEKCLLSALQGTKVPDTLCIIDNGREIAWQAPSIFEIAYQFNHVHFIVPERNLGVGASWNLMLSLFDDYALVCNDDIEFLPDSIEKLVRAAHEDTENVFFYAGEGANAWSCFIQKSAVFDKLGMYDPGFKQAYFEDNDMSYRLKLVGLRHVGVDGCEVKHAGSATVRAMSKADKEQAGKLFEHNRDYFIRKWGGMPDTEGLWTTPFNNGIESAQWHLDYAAGRVTNE
jgi:GT2 family glycosyltransferase